MNDAAARLPPVAPRRRDWRPSGVGAVTPRWRACAPGDGNFPALTPGQIHLWAVDLAPLQNETRRALLTGPELARAARLQVRKQRAMYLGGRIGLRLLLSAYTGIANAGLRFIYGAKGKPALANQPPGGELNFNYTLSANRALYAFAWNRRVGVDLETWPRKINAARLAKRKLTPGEQRAWRSVPVRRRERAMLACWTRKEAYGKALGVGIRYALNQAPVFEDIDSPVWQCPVRGLFDAEPAGRHGQLLHGIQLAPPFPGIAALVHDGAALAAPAAGRWLRAWRF